MSREVTTLECLLLLACLGLALGLVLSSGGCHRADSDSGAVELPDNQLCAVCGPSVSPSAHYMPCVDPEPWKCERDSDNE